MNKGKRLSSKDYDELLKSMRRWVNPYREMVAKLIQHIAWQLSEIDRLNGRLKKLEQEGLQFESQKPYEPFKPKIELPKLEKPEDVRAPLPERLLIMQRNGVRGSEEWLRTLKWNNLTEADADVLMDNHTKNK